MRRVAAAFVLAATVAVIGTTAAWAKEIGAVSLSGPGIDGSVKLNPSDVARWANMNIHAPRLDAAPESDLLSALGPMYVATWELPACNVGELPPSVRVDVYPYARGGVLLHVRPGSLCARRIVEPGWWQGEEHTIRLLHRYGVSLLDPRATVGGIDEGSGRRSYPVGIYVGAAVLLVLVLGAVAWSRHRLSPNSKVGRPATP